MDTQGAIGSCLSYMIKVLPTSERSTMLSFLTQRFLRRRCAWHRRCHVQHEGFSMGVDRRQSGGIWGYQCWSQKNAICSGAGLERRSVFIQTLSGGVN